MQAQIVLARCLRVLNAAGKSFRKEVLAIKQGEHVENGRKYMSTNAKQGNEFSPEEITADKFEDLTGLPVEVIGAIAAIAEIMVDTDGSSGPLIVLIGVRKPLLDDEFVPFLTGHLTKYDSLEPAQRRSQILASFGLGVDASDAELAAAVQQTLSELFQEPLPEELLKQSQELVVNKAAV